MRLLLLATLALGAHTADFRAGVAKTHITPATHEVMWGFEDRLTPAASTLDPLYARVLVLEAGKMRLAIVTLDLGRSFGPGTLAKLRETAQRESGISCLLVSATHTHSAPVIRDEYASGPPEWERVALEKIERAIAEATARLVEVRIGTGAGSVAIGHNRLKPNASGGVSWFERNPGRLPTKPVDPTVSVIRIDDTHGGPIAILANYACHPVVLGSDNEQYSADFPAATHRVVEAEMGGQAMSFYLQGGAGDINPYYAVTPIRDGAVKWRDWTGERLGREIARVAKSIHTQASADPSTVFSQEAMPMRLRWDEEKFKAALLKFLGPKTLELYGAPIAREFPVSISTVLIGRQIAIATFPGEPFVDFQIDWRGRNPSRTAILMGYTNGYHGYFPTIQAAIKGGYGAASASTWVEVGAGERILDRATVKINEMLGRLSDLPDDLKKNVYQ